MKILITVKTYWPEVNGVQNVTQYQAEGLAKKGHEVIVLTSDYRGKYSSSEVHNGVTIYRLPIYDKNTFHYGNKKDFQKKVLEIVSDCDAMFNVCLQGWAADWVLPILSKIKCRKVLMNHSMHDFVWRKSDFRTLKDFAKKAFKNIKYGFFYRAYWKKIMLYDSIAFSHEKDYAFEYFKKHGYKNGCVLYNAVDDSFFDLRGVQKGQIVINVGSFNDRKNQLKTLELFYKANTRDYKLILIGMPNNDYYKQIVRYDGVLKEKYGAKDVQIFCNLDSEKTLELFKKAKIYMTNSTWECLPISLIDAMSGGAAFLSTDVGVIKYLPGGMVARTDSDMIKNLESLVEGSWKKLGIIAREYCEENFKKKTQVDKLEKVLLGENL